MASRTLTEIRAVVRGVLPVIDYLRVVLGTIALAFCLAIGLPSGSSADELAIVGKVEAQPFKAQAKRVAEALQYLGEPLTNYERAALDAAIADTDSDASVKSIQKVLDARCLAGVNINPESRVKVARGANPAELVEQGWRVFLIKVHNEAGVTAGLRVSSPSAAATVKSSSGSPSPKPSVTPEEVSDRWMDLTTFDAQPLNKTLSGLLVEYRIVQLFSRERGKREAMISFDVGQGTQDLGFRSEVAILFECQPAVPVRLMILDDDGKPTTASLVIKDRQGRVYPARSRRLAPDFFFHDQIYRTDGEEVRLPAGSYEVTYGRGPEYIISKRTIEVPAADGHAEAFRLKRWIKLSDFGWYSGDHHVHAAGCAHYEAPTQGVTPEDMMRHIVGEDLNVGCVLSWGPCWYHQKEFFEGQVNKLSTKNYLMRYDVEVSGFPSSHAGHLCLLRLKEDDFPGTTTIDQWPSWNLPVLKWGKEQGGVVGYSHSGWGLQVDDDQLPSYKMPKFDGIGANEYVVDVVHDACDFISAVDTPIVWELSVWYHTLNCGYRCKISGETDFPCIYGDRVGLGRIYVKLDDKKKLTFDDWVFGLRDGRSYCTDGLTHLIDFRVNGVGAGEKGDDERVGLLAIEAGEQLKVSAKAAALLEDEPLADVRKKPLADKPYWHVERARIGESRSVPVELIVNGQSVERKEIAADGSVQDIAFDYRPERSCWVAMRVFPAAHTNPVFVEVGGKPIRASKRSAEWCRKAVDVCWERKQPQIRDSEKEAAAAAYEVARRAYDKILTESFEDRAAN
jgi:hypothetical protein